MLRRVLIVLALLLGCVCWWSPRAQAGATALSYSALQPCYPAGRPLPTLTLTVRVAATGTYRVTHQVTLAGSPPGTVQTVFNGPLETDKPRSIALTGGTAAVPGTYTLRALLYGSDNVVLSETTRAVKVATSCPVATPTAPAGPPSAEPLPTPARVRAAPARAEVRWSQTLTTTATVGQRPTIGLLVRAFNDGQGSGTSEAVMTYDPAALELIDVTPRRSSDWVRSRDDGEGALAIALGSLAPEEQVTVLVRFVLSKNVRTVVRLQRADGHDRANPVLIAPDQLALAPLSLHVRQEGTAFTIVGQGYKPGEPVVGWANTRQGHAIALEGRWNASQDDNGSLELTMSLPSEKVVSLVFSGQWSGIVGVASIPNEKRSSG